MRLLDNNKLQMDTSQQLTMHVSPHPSIMYFSNSDTTTVQTLIITSSRPLQMSILIFGSSVDSL